MDVVFQVQIIHNFGILKLSSIYVFSYFPFGFEGRIWDLIVSVPDYCLSFYFTVYTYARVGEYVSSRSCILI